MLVETYSLPHDLKVFGFQVKSFPEGIGEAFDALLKLIPERDGRSYFGISKLAKDGTILYYATAEETFDGEGKKYDGKIFILKKGEYLAASIYNWRKKTDCIKDVFNILMNDSRIDRSEPCIEWYKNEAEMLCVIRKNPVKK